MRLHENLGSSTSNGANCIKIHQIIKKKEQFKNIKFWYSHQIKISHFLLGLELISGWLIGGWVD